MMARTTSNSINVKAVRKVRLHMRRHSLRRRIARCVANGSGEKLARQRSSLGGKIHQQPLLMILSLSIFATVATPFP
jgi:hypothetical protein